jgi:CubicO group peptidase (beta-lactamase class C family)
MMAPLPDPRPARRRRRRIVAAATALVGVLACAVGLSAVAGPPPGSGIGRAAGGAGGSGPAASIAASGGATASSSAGSSVAGASASPAGTGASPSPGSPASTPPVATPAPGRGGPTLAELRTLAIRGLLQRRLDETRARLGIPGAQVTIIFRDGTSWTGSSGRSDVGAGVEVSAGTAFALASVSKTYTAALVLALAGDGRIDLDAPARTYLPGAAIDRRITVRQLLDHTSGLDDYFLHPPIDRALQAEPDAFWSVRRTLRYVGKAYFPPGTGWHYSNTNYLYLGLIAERVAGTPLAVALRDRFFTPLGLHHTWYQAVEAPLGPVAHGYRFASSRVTAPPIDLSDGTDVVPFTSVVTAAAGAGSIAATSADVATWARLLYGGEVLGPAMTEEMIGGVTATAAYRPRVPYGLGVQAFSIDGRPTLGHSGRFLGFRASVRHFPTEALTIAVLTNQSRADPGVIIESLLDIVFRPDRPCQACRHSL